MRIIAHTDFHAFGLQSGWANHHVIHCKQLAFVYLAISICTVCKLLGAWSGPVSVYTALHYAALPMLMDTM
jgi:hypothetical protein